MSMSNVSDIQSESSFHEDESQVTNVVSYRDIIQVVFFPTISVAYVKFQLLDLLWFVSSVLQSLRMMIWMSVIIFVSENSVIWTITEFSTIRKISYTDHRKGIMTRLKSIRNLFDFHFRYNNIKKWSTDQLKVSILTRDGRANHFAKLKLPRRDVNRSSESIVKRIFPMTKGSFIDIDLGVHY